MEKQFANRNLQNQGKIINNAIDNRADVGLAMGGSRLTPEQRQAFRSKMNSRHVNTSAIG